MRYSVYAWKTCVVVGITTGLLALLALFWTEYVRNTKEQAAISAIDTIGGRLDIIRNHSSNQIARCITALGLGPDEEIVHGVNLNNTKATDSTFLYLSHFRQLLRLHLSGTEISNAGLYELSKLNNLKWLDLSDTDITDHGLKYMTSMDNLEHLDLCNTKITYQGVRKMEKMLPNCVIWHDYLGGGGVSENDGQNMKNSNELKESEE